VLAFEFQDAGAAWPHETDGTVGCFDPIQMLANQRIAL
jgi:hypothetical protein